MSRIVDAILRYKKGLASQFEQEMSYASRRWAGVVEGLRSEMDSFALHLDALRQRGEPIPQWKLHKMERYKRLASQAQAQWDRYSKWADTYTQSLQKNWAELGIDQAKEVLDMTGVDASFSMLPTDVLDTVMGMTADGTPLSDLLKAKLPDCWGRMEDELLNGLAVGRSPVDIAKRMAERFNRLYADIICMAQTETMRAYREASRETYKQSGVVSGYKRICAKDSRVCLACIASDGKKYTLDQSLNDHPMGRCALVPIVDGVREPQWPTAKEWFGELPADKQREIMGPARYDLMKQGDLSLDKFIDTRSSDAWGDSIQPKSLKDLRA